MTGRVTPLLTRERRVALKLCQQLSIYWRRDIVSDPCKLDSYWMHDFMLITSWDA